MRDEQHVGWKETILYDLAADALSQPLATAPSLSWAAHIALGACQREQELKLVQRDPTEQGLKRQPPSVCSAMLVRSGHLPTRYSALSSAPRIYPW